MDLHFSDSAATAEEAAVIDQFVSQAAVGIPDGKESDSQRRSLLLPLLHVVQKEFGYISPGALNCIARGLGTPPAEVYGTASFYSLFYFEPQAPTTIHLCDDIACRCHGAELLVQHMMVSDAVVQGMLAIKRSPCLGLCERAPAALVIPTGLEHADYSVAPASLELTDDVLSRFDKAKRTVAGSKPQANADLDRLLLLTDLESDHTLQDYLNDGGFQALAAARTMGPGAVVEAVRTAALTGRGGAAFPTAMKWESVARETAAPHYVVCNADESEPGTFKDRIVMEQAPFALLEALAIAGFACGAEKGYIYIRGEYPEATARLEKAIDECDAAGVFESEGSNFRVEIRRGAGAYICGEETALLNSIEGYRGEPRSKPPFPSQVGLFGKPTAINNVETLLNVLSIVSAETKGLPIKAASRLFCVSGCVEKPGLYELEAGITARQLLELAGGVRSGNTLQAVLLGGAAGSFLRPDELDLVLTNEAARVAGVSLGSGVFMVFDETIDMKDIVRRIAEFFRDESCGQCVPCRVGTVRQEEAFFRLLNGGNPGEELCRLRELDKVMKDASICGLGHTASSALISAVDRLNLFAVTPEETTNGQ